MSKRKITKASKRRLTIFGTISIIAIFYFVFNFIYSSFTIYNLIQEKKDLEKLYTQLEEKAEDLKLDIEKLDDPKYLADYARENYLYSKDNEYILQIEEIIETQEEIDTDINKNYILLGLSAIVFLMFLYILLKGNKKNHKKKKL